MADGNEDEGPPGAPSCGEHADWIEAGHPRSPFPCSASRSAPAGPASSAGKLFDDVARIVRPTGRRVVIGQIKEKFGTLRSLLVGAFDRETSDRIDEAVDLAEFRSACTCEECGARGSLRVARGWYAVRCTTMRPRAAGGSRRRRDLSGNDSRGEFWKVDYDPATDTVTRTRLTKRRIRRPHEEKTR